MAKFQFKGIDDYISKLEKLNSNTDEIIGAAIYEGAAVVMKNVVNEIENIQTDNRFGTPENPTKGPNEYQKEGLRQSVGIAPMRNDGGFRNVKIGFDGYNGLHTETWPQGQPNSMVARAVESGTSWMTKQPFMRRAEQESKRPCEAAMAKAIDKAVEEAMEGRKYVATSKGSTGGSGSGSIPMGGGSKGPRSYKAQKRKTSARKKSAVSFKKLAARYKKIDRNIDKLINGKPINSTGALKKYVKKKRRRRK